MTKKTKKHSKYYYEENRNGWTPTSTNEVTDKKDKDREEMMGYVRELEGYVNDMENYLNKETLNKISPQDSDSFSSHLDSLSSQVIRLLKEKNKSYGNTALNPPNIFSKLDSTEAICARIDDKLSRIQNRGINDKTEDTIDDLIGYLFLLKMSIK